MPRGSWARYPSRVVPNTERLLDLFETACARGTFFVLGWEAERRPELVRTIAARGHEVASHGMTHRLITELSPEQFRAEARESKRRLEDLSGAPVRGYRAPSYSIHRGTLWALEILAEEGYAYDSSVYPIRGRRYGYPQGPQRPARITVGARTIAEFPLPTLPLGPLRLPVLAGAYLRLLPNWVSHLAARYHRDRGIPLVLNVHPWEIDREQPTVGRWRMATWTHYTRLGSTAPLLAALLRAARFSTVESRLVELGLLEGTTANRRPS